MRRLVTAAAAVGLAALLLVTACGGDDDGAGPTEAFTPAGTKEDTPTLAPDGGGGEAPDPAIPQLDEELTEIASGPIEATIEAGGSYSIDTLATAQEASGNFSLSCETSPNFAFGFAWQVQDPYPPDGVQLAWQLDRESGAVEIAGGASGEQTVGCEALKAVNGGGSAIRIALNYRAGVIQ